MKKAIISGIIFLITIGLLLPSLNASIEIDKEDGIWTDNFTDANTVNCTNCQVDEENGTIILNQSTIGRPYDFTEKNHKAYSYITRSFNFFSSPNVHTIFEDEFGTYDEYPAIKYGDQRYAERSSTILKKYVVHHFRFKLDVDAESIGNLEVVWEGKGDNERVITLYYWRYTPIKKFGSWWRLDSGQSDGIKNMSLTGEIDQDDVSFVISDEKYFDICLVATQSLGTICKIQTDYVKVISETKEGYRIGSAEATTNESIDPGLNGGFYWEMLTWEDSERGGATVKYHVLYENATGIYVPIEDDVLDGNEDGFTKPPVYLDSIPVEKNGIYNKLKIRAILTTDTHKITPKIFSWTVTWQKNDSRWQDLFNSDFRIDSKSKVTVEEDGYVTINPVSGDWPMFGNNPQNTRASDGNGPQSKVLHWFGDIGAGITLLDPVVMDKVLYITVMNSRHLYHIDDVSIPGVEDNWDISDKVVEEIDIFDKYVVSSPIVTDDYLIYATGETYKDGTENYIVALKKDNLNEEAWPSPFIYDGDICYWASPVVYDDKVFITSWSGDPDVIQSNSNNKVIALELSTGVLKWEHDLPDWSYSTPAVYNDIVVAGCKKAVGDNLFGLDAETGDELWNVSVGPIGKASPVIYDDTVYIMSKSMGSIKVTALNLNNGTILWTKIICLSSLVEADSTPAVYDDILYVTSPKGTILALDLKNEGEVKWSNKIYFKVGGDPLVASPAYADGLVYIGTPDGFLHAIDASDGSPKFTFQTFPVRENYAIITSPIVSNGLVFFGDENGRLYSVGSYSEPDVDISGNIISIPIYLPENKWWKQFYATVDEPSGSSITFSILDEDKNLIKTIKSGEGLTLENGTIGRAIRLRADLEVENSSIEPQLSSWYVTFETDSEAPYLDRRTFDPNPGGWLTEIVPKFSIKVKDNQTGLDISSAQYVLKYSDENESHTDTFNASCTGTDGTTSNETITANISKEDIYPDINDLHSITISIRDLAGNKAEEKFDLSIDKEKPTSSIIDDNIDDEAFNTSPIQIKATANDTGENDSGIGLVELYYRHSTTSVFPEDWEFFDNSTTANPTWNFTDVKGGGHYELITIATDKAGNVEEDISEVDEGDVTFILDPNPPDPPIFDKQDYWIKDTIIVTTEFKDDFKLDKIEYKPIFETAWTIIDSNIDEKSYDSAWEISQEHWEQMDEGVTYYLYFRLTDSLGNIKTSNEDERLAIKRDTAKPIVADLKTINLEAEWSWEDIFNISVYAGDDESGIETVKLEYSFSEDNNSWSNWTNYGDTLTSSLEYQWEFEAEEGNGYYRFRVIARDMAGNEAISDPLYTGINIFPLYLLISMIALFIILIFIIIVLFVKWRKK